MDPEQKLRIKWLAFLSIFTLVVVAVLPQPAAALPPRPEGDRDARQSGSGGHGDGGGAGAFIELHVRPPQPDLRAAVQWWEASGDWIEVEGWSGPVEENRPVLWWVNEADFGKGPFRWAVYTDSSPTEMLASDEFYLPRQVGETLSVRMIVLPAPTPSPGSTAMQTPGVESNPPPVATAGTQPALREGLATTALSPTLEAILVPTSSPAVLSPTFIPARTPSPGPPTASPVPVSTGLPSSVSDPSTIEAVLPVPPGLVEAAAVTEASADVAMTNTSALSLLVAQSVSPAAVSGRVITWTFSVRNPAGLAAEEIILGDVLPADLAYVGGRTSQGSIELIRDPQIVLVKLGRIPAGGQAEVEIFTQVPAGIEPGAIYSNFATYSSFNFGAGASNVAEVTVNEEANGNYEERGEEGFLSADTILGKGVRGSAILVLGALILIVVNRVRTRHQNRRQEQLR